MSLQQISPKNTKLSDFKNVSVHCPFCKSKRLIKRGLRKTENRGKIQRYSCKDCKRRFVENDGFYRMRNSPLKVTGCLDMYFRGVSLRKIQEHLHAFTPHNSSHMTILRWIRKYSIMIGKFTDGIKIKNSDTISFDEMEYKVKGKDSYFIDVIDTKTRYLLSSGFYYDRTIKELTEVLTKSKDNSINETLNFQSDGLKGYHKALKKSYNYSKRKKKYNWTIIKSSDKAFNWRIERLHNSIRERTKIMRQFGEINSAKAIMK